MRRSKRKWEPICHWCKDDMPSDEGWRTPLWGEKGSDAEGLLAGIVVCGPDCRDRPPDAPVYLKDHV